jgi:DNA-directed RNA polymerase specialized sigma24 family protein
MVHEQAQAVQLALERLPSESSEVLLLRYPGELPCEEIRRLMSRSSNAAEKL